MTARFSGDIKFNLMQNGQYEVDGDLYILEHNFRSETGSALAYPFGFAPTFHKYRFDYLEKLKSGQNIFVGAMADILGEWIPDEWIKMVMDECIKYERHNYLFLTKNPERYWDLEDKGIIPSRENMWYGFTYASNQSSGWGSKYNDKHNFVSVEPLLEDLHLFNEHCFPAGEWVIIGAETGNRKGKVAPQKEWIDKILKHCDKYKIPVFMKDSMVSVVGEDNMRREFPEQLQHKEISEKVKARLEDKCCKCGKHMRKNAMIALAARSKRGEMPKQLCHMCHKCFMDLCEELKIRLPELEGLKDEEKKLPNDGL